jgi:hypothetical protein
VVQIIEIKYKPIAHDHAEFLEKAMKRNGFKKAYNDLEKEYALVRERLASCGRLPS